MWSLTFAPASSAIRAPAQTSQSHLGLMAMAASKAPAATRAMR